MYCDAHTHLNSEKMFFDRQQYLDRFVDVWGRVLVNVWVNHIYNTQGLEIAEACRDRTDVTVKATVWLHPCEVWFGSLTRDMRDDERHKIVKLYENNTDHIVAIWEAWIDLHYEGTSKTLSFQQEVFARQCQRAWELWLPLVIHSRSARDQTREVLQDYPDLMIYFHCRGYDEEEIKKLSDRQSRYVWFCGNISYPKADEIRRSFHWVQNNWLLDHVVLETDAPYLSPQVKRWQQNEPSFVKEIYTYVSEQFFIEEKILQEKIYNNVLTLYNLAE